MIDTSKILAGGHRWMRCTSCGQAATTLEPGVRCRLRWGCQGRLALADAIAKGDQERCPRAGCRNVARFTTAKGERVCCRCLEGLAAIGMGISP